MCWGARALKTAIKKTTPPNKNENKKNKKKAIADYQAAEYAFSASLNLLNTVQSAIMFAGVGGGMLLVTASVAAGGASVGDVVLFLTLMAQLYGPLNFFGTYYRVIQQYMIDMEVCVVVGGGRGVVFVCVCVCVVCGGGGRGLAMIENTQNACRRVLRSLVCVCVH